MSEESNESIEGKDGGIGSGFGKENRRDIMGWKVSEELNESVEGKDGGIGSGFGKENK